MDPDWRRRIGRLVGSKKAYFTVHKYTSSHNLWRAYFIANGICHSYTSRCFKTPDEALAELFKYMKVVVKYEK